MLCPSCPLKCKKEEQSSPLTKIIINLTLVSKGRYHHTEGVELEEAISRVPIYRDRNHLKFTLQLLYSTLWDKRIPAPRLSSYNICLKGKRAASLLYSKKCEWYPFAVVLITRTTRACGILTRNGIYECSVKRNVEQIFAMICDGT
uniref:Uncharacterized protein n=1 Tax=Glossina pallidipes TaxID=7398 RepID=A0A1B0A7G8_GLOPL